MSRPRQNFDAVDARFFALYQEGCADREISERLGEPLEFVLRWRTSRKLPANRKPASRPDVPYSALFRSLYQEGLTDRAIAARVNCTRAHVVSWRRFAGLSANSIAEEITGDPYAPFFQERYDAGLTDQEIADAFAAHAPTAAAEVHTKRRVTYWRRGQNLPAHRRASDQHTIYLALYARDYTDREIAEMTGRSLSTITIWRIRNKYPPAPRRVGAILPERLIETMEDIEALDREMAAHGEAA